MIVLHAPGAVKPLRAACGTIREGDIKVTAGPQDDTGEALASHHRRTAEQPAPRFLGLGETDRQAGRVDIRLPDALLDRNGAVPVGALCMLADHTLGAWVTPAVEPKGLRLTTNFIQIDAIRTGKPTPAGIVGQAVAPEIGDEDAFATATASTPGGELLARMSGRFVLVRIDDESKIQRPHAPSSPVTDQPQTSAFADPVDRQLGLEIIDSSRQRSEIDVTCRQDFENNAGGLHGGVSGLLGERSCSLALEAATGGESVFRVVSLRVAYIRPIAVDDKTIRMRAEVLHCGRTQAATESRIFRADGKLAVQVSALHSRVFDSRTT